MAVAIIELADGCCSLEFAGSDFGELRERIGQRWGEVSAGPYMTMQTVTFGGQDFVYQSEWDDPCLLSRTAQGAALLRQLAQDMSGVAQ